MARSLRVNRPPPTGDRGLDFWLGQAADQLNQFPPFSTFSTDDGPNISGITAAQGTFGIEIGSSATTKLWFATSDGTSTWQGII